MNSPSFHSVLAEPLATFVQYKHALNRKYRTEAAALQLFDQYLAEHRIAGWESIDNILIDDFLKSRPRPGLAATTIWSVCSVAFLHGQSCKG